MPKFIARRPEPSHLLYEQILTLANVGVSSNSDSNYLLSYQVAITRTKLN